jgi:sugar/nucleoside kinase (ribokinase family)
MNRKMVTVVAGHLCLDIIPDLDALPKGEFLKLLQPGRLINIGPPLFSTGGAVSNTGLALHILGVKTQLMGKVGDDQFGQTVISLIRHHSGELTLGMIIDPMTSTSYTIIINPPGIDRIFLHDPGANDTFGPDDIDFDSLKSVDLFHFGYPPLMKRMYERNGEDLRAIFKQTRLAGVTTSLDMSLPDPASPSGQVNWPQILQETLPYVDIFTPSVEELLFTLRPQLYKSLNNLSGSNNLLQTITPEILSDLSSEVLDLGVKILLIKLGDRGAYLRTASSKQLDKIGRCKPVEIPLWSDCELWAPCFRVNVVGTTGSGDSTIAGFLSGLIRGKSPKETLTMAVAVGACNVESADAISGLLSWDETLQRVEAGWERHPLMVRAPGWKLDSDYQLWEKTHSA